MGVSLQEDGPTLEVGCPGERLVNVALPDGVPSKARQLRDDCHLTASRHSLQVYKNTVADFHRRRLPIAPKGVR